MPEKPKKSREPGRKLRHKLSLEQRLERTIKNMPGKNPILPVLIQSIERSLTRIRDPTDVDKITTKRFHKSRPPVSPEKLKLLVDTWNKIPKEKKIKIIPENLIKLSAKDPMYLKILRKKIPDDIVILPAGATITDINPKEPDSHPWVYFGQQFTITGTSFSSDNSKNSINISPVVNDQLQPGVTIFPSKSTPTKLTAFAPLSLATGDHAVSVGVEGKMVSNIIMCWFAEMPGPSPVITSVSPAAQYPGKKITITGQNFRDGFRLWWKSMDSAGSGTEYCLEGAELSADKKQAIVTIPDYFINFPGNYMIAASGNNQGKSNWWQTLTVKPYKYRIEFQEMKCVDESDPEWWGSDELVTMWVINRDDEFWMKQSSEYTGFDDNTVKTYNQEDRKVFMTDGSAGEVKSQLAINTQLYEWDEGDAKAWAEPLKKFGEWIKDISGWKWVEYVAQAIGYLIALLGGSPDNLGSKFIKWTPMELYSKTNTTSKSFLTKLDFLNDDDTGSFSVSFTVFRVED